MMRAARLCFVVVVAYAPVALADTVVNWNIASMNVLFSSRQQAGLSLEDRIGYQRAIEEVYWRHRIWPKQNYTQKPALEQVMPLSVIRAKVEDYLRKSQALEVHWQRPIAAEQLQAEMERMARQTKQPEVLKELWAVLGNDPHVIAECLARPALANRLLRNWYAHDERYHGKLKARAEAELGAYRSASQMRQMSGEYLELEWVKKVASQQEPARGAPAILSEASNPVTTLSAEQWEAKVGELTQLFVRREETMAQSHLAAGLSSHFNITPGPADVGSQVHWLPTGELTPLQEDEERFYVTAVLEKGFGRLKVAAVEWRKESFDTWWSRVRDEVQGQVAVQRYSYRLPQAGSVFGSCADDTWTPTFDLPSARRAHTAVWTGSEMIVWGGFEPGGSSLNTGGRYDPATDSWTATGTFNAPSARYDHTAVWTGSQMIVWGGAGLNTGGRYDPATDSWRATNRTTAPGPRERHIVVWAGTEMIVWGGFLYDSKGGGEPLDTGGRYDPATDSWRATNTANAPSPRSAHTAVWTGSEMIVWGGYGVAELNSGGRYDPSTNSWRATNTTNAPSPRSAHTAVWTGSEMIVWGGESSFTIYFNTGGRYDPGTDSWTPTDTSNAPSRRSAHTVVWTGGEMIVWGGGINSGGRYDPATDSWTATNTYNVPGPRSRHTAVWTGTEMIVWGGGANTGGRYDPATDSWTATSTSNAPSERERNTAVWTGSEMIVWGGLGPGSSRLNTGGRYDPAVDSWTATETFTAPSARFAHTAVWTGSEMIIWGGLGVSGYFNTGGRYDPVTDGWAVTSTISAPSPRPAHTAVWTGSEMIVWGGVSPEFTNTGGRYDPATDGWVATDTTTAPSGRTDHTVVWTGSEMIVWGGFFGGFTLNTGGRYDPATDAWAATNTSAAPSARWRHTAVWTGSEMIIWGGAGASNTGGRYDPGTDSWRATNRTTPPSARYDHTAVWTGSEMIVWGGGTNTGGRYCVGR